MNGALVVTEGDVNYVYVYGCQPNPSNAAEAGGGALHRFDDGGGGTSGYR